MRSLLARLKDVFLRVPTRFQLERVGGYFDGGTTVIEGHDEHGCRRRIWLTQQMIPRESWFDPPLGRLYLGCRWVPKRSRAEVAILALVERLLAEQEAAGPVEGEVEGLYTFRVYSLRWLLEYVRSDSYGQVVP